MKNYEKERAENKDKKLLLLGTATSCFEPDYENTDYEIWGVGSSFGKAHADIKRLDLGFEIHPLNQVVKIAQERHVDYNKFDCPILVQNHMHPLAKQMMKNPKTFPLKEVLDYVEKMGAAKFFTSSFCYMLVYAAMLGFKEIHLYKILLTNDGEYFLERPGVEYWIEWLGMHEGIKFYFPEDAEMCSDTILYGYEDRPNIWKLESRKKFLWECLSKHFYEIENLTSMLSRASAMLEYNHLIKNTKQEVLEKLLQECKETIDSKQGMYRGSRDKYLQFSGALQTLQFSEERSY